MKSDWYRLIPESFWMKPQPSMAKLAPLLREFHDGTCKFHFHEVIWCYFFHWQKCRALQPTVAFNELRVGSLRDSASHPTTSQAGWFSVTFCPTNQGTLCNGWREKVMFEGKVRSEILRTSNGTYWQHDGLEYDVDGHRKDFKLQSHQSSDLS